MLHSLNESHNINNNYEIKSTDKEVMWQFEECNKKRYSLKTNIHCFWCCNPFDTVPCFAPCYSKNTFKVLVVL